MIFTYLYFYNEMSSQAFYCNSIIKRKLTCLKHWEQSVGLAVYGISRSFTQTFSSCFYQFQTNWEELFDSCFYSLQASYWRESGTCIRKSLACGGSHSNLLKYSITFWNYMFILKVPVVYSSDRDFYWILSVLQKKSKILVFTRELFEFQHFVCAKCERPFFGTRHYEKKGLAYCETHYHQVCFQNKREVWLEKLRMIF